MSPCPARAPLRLRPMRREDLGEVLAIENASFSLAWTEASFLSELDAVPHSRLRVVEGDREAEEGGKKASVLGYCCWWKVLDECHIANFAIAPSARGRGVGGFLLTGVLDEARRMGVARATLEVRVGNASAIAFYERHGFQSVAMRPRYYPDNREDAFVMWKERL